MRKNSNKAPIEVCKDENEIKSSVNP